MTALADPEKLREHPTAAICGQNILFPPERMGCGQPIETCAEVYRCTECSVPFHKACADKHFATSAENRQKTIASQATEIAELKHALEHATDPLLEVLDGLRDRLDAVCESCQERCKCRRTVGPTP